MKLSDISTEIIYKIWVEQSRIIKERFPGALDPESMSFEEAVRKDGLSYLRKSVIVTLRDDAIPLMDVPGLYEKVEDIVRSKYGVDYSTIVPRKRNIFDKITSKGKISSNYEYYIVKEFIEDNSNLINELYPKFSEFISDYELKTGKIHK